MNSSVRMNASERVMEGGARRPRRSGEVEREFVEDVDAFPRRLPSDVFSIQVRGLSTDEGFERPLQDRRPIKIPFVVRHLVRPLAIFVYGARGSSSNPLAINEPMSKIWPMSDWVKGLPPGKKNSSAH